MIQYLHSMGYRTEPGAVSRANGQMGRRRMGGGGRQGQKHTVGFAPARSALSRIRLKTTTTTTTRPQKDLGRADRLTSTGVRGTPKARPPPLPRSLGPRPLLRRKLESDVLAWKGTLQLISQALDQAVVYLSSSSD